MEKLIYSASPHVKSAHSTRRIMIEVSIALLPACIAGCVFFGLGALLNLAIATVCAVLAEGVYLLCVRKSIKEIVAQFDFTSVVTGLLIGMNVFVDSQWYVPMLASTFAIVIVKMVFGGTGKNIVNPAIAGRIFAVMAFGAALAGTMTFPAQIESISGGVVTGGTPLGAILNPLTAEGGVGSTLSLLDLLLGTGMAGTIGETCKVALLAGGIYLCVRGILNFRWPIVYIAVTGLVTVALNGFNFEVFLPAILSGGLILGAVFMATDYVTSPVTKLGNYIYFVLLGTITAVLRHFTKAEVVSFAILLGNLIAPLIDQYIVRRPFGYVKPQKQKEAK